MRGGGGGGGGGASRKAEKDPKISLSELDDLILIIMKINCA